MNTQLSQEELITLAKNNTETLRFFPKSIKAAYVLIATGIFLLCAAVAWFYLLDMKKFAEGKSLDYTFYAILLGFGIMGVITGVYLISKTKKPFIVLTQTGIALPGFVAEIPWAIIADYEIKDLDGSGTFVRVDLKISDPSKMPNEKGFTTTVDFDKKSQKVILGIQPLRNAKADLVVETILAYWQSAQARQTLQS